jgi:CMP-N-acetylneuraminic acid synthetase
MSKIVIVIPAKKKSRRLKNKNILPIQGIPMFLYVANEISKSKYIDEIIISSDCNKIKKITLQNDYVFVKRPRKLTLESAEKQDVVVHAIRKVYKRTKKPDIVISLQPNSPELRYKDLEKALIFFNKKLYPGAKKKELISINKNKIQNAAFRIMTYNTVFQKTLSTKIGVYVRDLIDIHTYKEYLDAKKKIEKKNK